MRNLSTVIKLLYVIHGHKIYHFILKNILYPCPTEETENKLSQEKKKKPGQKGIYDVIRETVQNPMRSHMKKRWFLENLFKRGYSESDRKEKN